MGKIVLHFECDGFLTIEDGKPTAVSIAVRPPMAGRNPFETDRVEATDADLDEAMRIFDQDAWSNGIPVELEG